MVEEVLAAEGAEPVVEVVGQRTESSKTFSTGVEGVFVTEVSAEPLHVVDDATGGWVDVDVSGVVGAGGVVETAAAPVVTRLGVGAGSGGQSGGSGGGVGAGGSLWGRVEFGGGRSVGFGAGSGRVGVPAVAGSEVAYRGVWEDTDVVFDLLASGVKESIVLGSPDAPREFVFPLSLEGVVAEVDPVWGHVWFRSIDDGGLVAQIPKGWMVDARFESVGVAEDEVFSEGVSYEVVGDGAGGSALRVVLDSAWLDEEGRVWPVVVDPTLVAVEAGDDDTYVTPYVSSDRSSLGWWYSGSLGGFHNYPYVHVDTSGLAGKVVHGAEFLAWQMDGTTCEDTATHLHAVTGSWEGLNLTWGSKPPVDPVPAATAYSGLGAGGCEDGEWVAWGVTDLVRSWVGGEVENHGLSLRADAPLDPANWKKFASGDTTLPPHLSVVWSDPGVVGGPYAPSQLSPAGRVDDRSPTLSARYRDPDGDDGLVVFVISDADTNEILGYPAGSVTASGGVSVYEPGPGEELVPGRTYRIEAWGVDTAGVWSLVGAEAGVSVDEVAFVSPAPSSMVFGVADVEVEVASAGVSEVNFVLDGEVVAVDTDGADGWVWSWDTVGVSEGVHGLRADAVVGSGVVSSSVVWVVVDNLAVSGLGEGRLLFGGVAVEAWWRPSGVGTAMSVVVDDGGPLAGVDPEPDGVWAATVDTVGLVEGDHVVRVELVVDGVVRSETVGVVVANDASAVSRMVSDFAAGDLDVDSYARGVAGAVLAPDSITDPRYLSAPSMLDPLVDAGLVLNTLVGDVWEDLAATTQSELLALFSDFPDVGGDPGGPPPSGSEPWRSDVDTPDEYMDGCDPTYPTEWRAVEKAHGVWCEVRFVSVTEGVPDVIVYYTLSENGGMRGGTSPFQDVKADRAGTSELPAGLDHTVPQHEALPRVPVAVAAVAEWVWRSRSELYGLGWVSEDPVVGEYNVVLVPGGSSLHLGSDPDHAEWIELGTDMATDFDSGADRHRLPIQVSHEVAHGVVSPGRSGEPCTIFGGWPFGGVFDGCIDNDRNSAPWYSEWRAQTLALGIVEDEPNGHDSEQGFQLVVARFLDDPGHFLMDRCRPRLIAGWLAQCDESRVGLERAYGSALFGLYLVDQFGDEILHEIEAHFRDNESVADAMEDAIVAVGGNPRTVIADFWVAAYLLSNQDQVVAPEYNFRSVHADEWRTELRRNDDKGPREN